MNRTNFYIITGLGIAIGLAILITLKIINTSPTNSITKKIKKTAPQDTFASITIKNFTLKELEKNKEIEVIVNAQKCNFLHTSDMVECTHVTCTLIDHQKTSAILKTDKAFVNRTQKTIFLTGCVEGHMKDLAIQGTDIYYNFSQQTLTTNKNILCTHPDFNISCCKSFIDLKNNLIKMSGGIFSEFITLDKLQQP